MTPVIRVVCAWCDIVIKDGEEPASHGICARCRAIYFPKTGRDLEEALTP